MLFMICKFRFQWILNGLLALFVYVRLLLQIQLESIWKIIIMNINWSSGVCTRSSYLNGQHEFRRSSLTHAASLRKSIHIARPTWPSSTPIMNIVASTERNWPPSLRGEQGDRNFPLSWHPSDRRAYKSLLTRTTGRSPANKVHPK